MIAHYGFFQFQHLRVGRGRTVLLALSTLVQRSCDMGSLGTIKASMYWYLSGSVHFLYEK